jgi:hypothetical protein
VHHLATRIGDLADGITDGSGIKLAGLRNRQTQDGARIEGTISCRRASSSRALAWDSAADFSSQACLAVRSARSAPCAASYSEAPPSSRRRLPVTSPDRRLKTSYFRLVLRASRVVGAVGFMGVSPGLGRNRFRR